MTGKETSGNRLAGGVALVLAGACAVVLAFRGDLNVDEGYFALAARSVGEGKLPYRDFALSQTPLYPLICAPFQHFFPGLLVGRLLGAFFLFGSVLVLMSLLQRFALQHWGWWLLAVVAGCPALWVHGTQGKAYSLTTLLLLSAFWVLEQGGLGAFFGSGLLVGLAGMGRLSALSAVGGLVLGGSRSTKGVWAVTGALGGTFAGVLAGGGWLFFLATEAFWYHTVTFHQARDLTAFGGSIWAGKAEFLLHQAAAFPGVCLAGIVWLMAVLKGPAAGGSRSGEGPFLIAGLLITFAHFSGSVTGLDVHYQAIAAWPLLLGFAIGIEARQTVFREKAAPILAGFSLVVFLAFAVRGGGWGVFKAESDLARTSGQAQEMRDLLPPVTVLLTPDTYLAVEAGLPVAPGYEGCFFSPQFDDAQASALHVVNAAMLSHDLASGDIGGLAVKRTTFSRRYPDFHPVEQAMEKRLWAVLATHYELAGVLQDVGPWHEEELVFRRRSSK